MSKLLFKTSPLPASGQEPQTPLQRRTFLRYSGVGLAATGLVLTGCNDVLEEIFQDQGNNPATQVNVGSGDFGILNYAYALEQLEAAFYAAVLLSPYYATASAAERQALQDIEGHERLHRDFLKQAIQALGGTPIRTLLPNFTSINFRDRGSVLGTAKAFEDLGVAAYNGAGKLIASAAYLTLAGKIVSVEARHAALIRDLLENGTFVGPDVVNLTNGLEKSKTPAEVVLTANTFLLPGSKLNVSNLPTQ